MKKRKHFKARLLDRKTILAVSAVVFLIVLTAFRDDIAKAWWEKYRMGSVAIFLAQSDAAFLAELGNYYFNGGAYNLKNAARAYEKATRLDPTLQWGHYQLARIYFAEGKYDEALDEINTEQKLYSENFRAYYVRGLIYGYRTDLGKAETDFREFIKWAPREWAGYNDLAWILTLRNNYRDAEDVIRQAFHTVPEGTKNPWLWNSLGVAELNRGENAKAAHSFEEAKKLAAGLTENDWARAYPGNDKKTAEDGLKSFRETIEENLSRSKVSP
ncbi:MAG: tetratricopeptide repeat protein [Candidatus Sungbacteria bacterium]|nr:tetratricopeptide repeat protein [Candidatus Sungbacteria bacterium]